MKEKIKIASGQGFWGDLIDAPSLYPEFISGSLGNLKELIFA